jgi:hypothetical protein
MTVNADTSPARDAVLSALAAYLGGPDTAAETPDGMDPLIYPGIDAVIRADNGGLRACGYRVAPVTHRLKDLVEPDDEAGTPAPFTYLADHQRIREARRRGYDPVLYSAYRDILPPRGKHADDLVSVDPDHAAHTAPSRTCWRADLVVYCVGTLPDGEPFRSIGHWNAPEQVEIFQTITGQTMLVTVSPDARVPDVRWQLCGPGDIAVVPPGDWHLTYCLNGPAAVFNIYTDVPADTRTRQRDHPAAGHDAILKYWTNPAPEVAVRRTARGTLLIGDSSLVAAAEPIASPAWIRHLLGPGQPLSWLYLNASRDMLDQAKESAQTRPARSPGRVNG